MPDIGKDTLVQVELIPVHNGVTSVPQVGEGKDKLKFDTLVLPSNTQTCGVLTGNPENAGSEAELQSPYKLIVTL